MTGRERYIEALLFGTPDRIPFDPGGPREKTLQRWHAEGLPANEPWRTALYRELGIEAEPDRPRPQPQVDFKMVPRFE